MTATLADFQPLWPAEERLKADVASGQTLPISDGLPPEDAPHEVRIRASFLRYLARGGCEKCSPGPKGVRLSGAYIESDETDPRAEMKALDLEGCTLPGDLALFDCRLPDLLMLRGASLTNLFLNRSVLSQGLSADRLQATGNVVLDGAESHGEVRLLGARLGGDLDCDGTTLRAGKSGCALNAQGLEAKGSFFLRGGATVTGVLDLTGAEGGALVDDAASWPGKGDLILNRFRYGAILGRAPVDAPTRLRWLALQEPARVGQDFWPQPYEQLATVLREMGHREDARAVLIEKERLQRADRRRRLPLRKGRFVESWDGLLGATVGYGHAPLRAVGWLGAFALAGLAVFGLAAQLNMIKPNNPFILRSPEWAACAEDYRSLDDKMPPSRWEAGADPYDSQLACFADQPEADAFPGFNAFVYSLDTLLPVVDMEMQGNWIPDARHGFGAVARVYLWLHIAAGWALSLLAVAGFSGLIKSD